jgi:hypothetical protein
LKEEGRGKREEGRGKREEDNEFSFLAIGYNSSRQNATSFAISPNLLPSF